MFKTRQNKLFTEHETIIVGTSFNSEVQAEYIEFFESVYSHSPSIVDIYNRVHKSKYFAMNTTDIEGKATITLIDDETPDPSFEISGPVILIYYHLIQNSIPDMIKTVIAGYVSRFMLPDTLFKEEFDTNVKKYICRKKHGPIFCPIESEQIKPGRTVCELACGHKFTSRAIRKWLTKSNGHCPMCRSKVRTDEQEDDFVQDTTNAIIHKHYTGIYRMVE